MDGPGAAGQRSAHAALPQAPHAARTFAVGGGDEQQELGVGGVAPSGASTAMNLAASSMHRVSVGMQRASAISRESNFGSFDEEPKAGVGKWDWSHMSM